LDDKYNDMIDTTIQDAEFLCTIRLTTGEELLAAVIESGDEGVTVENPIIIRTIPVFEENGFTNKYIVNPFMQFSRSRTFFLLYKDVSVLEPLHPGAFDMYKSHVNRLYSTAVDDMIMPSPTSFIVEPTNTVQ